MSVIQLDPVVQLVQNINELYRDTIGSQPVDDSHAADWAFRNGLIRDDERGALALLGI